MGTNKPALWLPKGEHTAKLLLLACCTQEASLSVAAILQPVRMPGSSPSTTSWPAGGASSRFWRFSRKTWMASASARCLSSRRTSPVMELLSRRAEDHTSELQSLRHLVCRLLLEKKNIQI